MSIASIGLGLGLGLWLLVRYSMGNVRICQFMHSIFRFFDDI